MKILAVDDSMTARMIIKRTFESQDHEVHEAENGVAALSVLRSEEDVQLVVLDWNMPMMNGLECLKEIRADPNLKGVKVIMCTTESEKSQVVKAVKVGVDGYVVKPVQPDVLKAQTAKACGVAV